MAWALIVLPPSILKIETPAGLEELCFFLHCWSFIIDHMFFQKRIDAALWSALQIDLKSTTEQEQF